MDDDQEAFDLLLDGVPGQLLEGVIANLTTMVTRV
jgi:hypothetical protein